MAELKDRLLDKLSGWRAKLLSQAGRGTLIRSVASPLLAHSMSFFELPKSWCLEVDRGLKNFWWGHNPETSRHLSLKSWSSLCCPKSEGGLGFRLSSDFNHALLSKLVWCVANDSPNIWVNFLKGKYLHHTGFWEAEGHQQASWIWRGILHMRKFLEKGLCFLIGNGENVMIWRDPWIPSIPGFKPSPNNVLHDEEVSVVADLIDKATGQWNRSLLWSLFSPEHAEAITKIHLSVSTRCDQLIWTYEKSGRFSVKSLYREVIKDRYDPVAPVGGFWWRKLWKLRVHERLKLCLWKLLWDVIPTKSKLAERMGSREDEDLMCVLCGKEIETTHHLLVGCIVSRILWSQSPWALDTGAFLHHPLLLWLTSIIDPSVFPELSEDDYHKFQLYALIAWEVTW